MLWSFYPIIFTASGAYLLTMTIFQRAVEANQAVFLHWYECPINQKGRKEGMAKKVLGTPVEKWKRLSSTYGLHPLQPCQTWLCSKFRTTGLTDHFGVP